MASLTGGDPFLAAHNFLLGAWPMPTTPTPARPLLGTSLLQDGWITQEQLDLAVRETKRKGVMLGQTLIGLGFITEKVLAHYLAEGTQTGLVDLSTVFIPPDIVNLIP